MSYELTTEGDDRFQNNSPIVSSFYSFYFLFLKYTIHMFCPATPFNLLFFANSQFSPTVNR